MNTDSSNDDTRALQQQKQAEAAQCLCQEAQSPVKLILTLEKFFLFPQQISQPFVLWSNCGYMPTFKFTDRKRNIEEDGKENMIKN